MGRRAILLFGIYFPVLLAAAIAGAIGQALGIWAAVLCGVVFVAGLVLFGRRRLRQPSIDP
jgi:hypothetical protein